MKLWDKGFSIDKKIEEFTVGNDREIDLIIAPYDVKASLAHAEMLSKVGLLTSDEFKKLESGLNKILNQIDLGTFKIENSFEDVHSKIEYELTQQLGDVGKKIHTARSRNDQILVALHLYYKDQLLLIKQKVKVFFDTLLDLAEAHKQSYLPGYTHLQVAMPSSFGLWFSAYAELLIDDVFGIDATLKVADQNPLGSAAGYGSSFPIDRELTTKILDFSVLKYNVVAAQMSRGKTERTIANTLSNLGYTLSKFAMDICLYNSQNFGFISFPDHLTTGSSIMPHKKNPDVFELIRGKCNGLQALPQQIQMLTNNLPSGYHRDFQLLKEPIILAFSTLEDVLDIFTYSLKHIEVKDIDLSDEKYSYLFTVDSVNDLVMNNKSFREAYIEIGKAIADGTYKAGQTKEHSHTGSIHNLSLDNIRHKFPK